MKVRRSPGLTRPKSKSISSKALALDDNQNVPVSCREKYNSHSTFYTLGGCLPQSLVLWIPLEGQASGGRRQDKQVVLGPLPVVPATLLPTTSGHRGSCQRGASDLDGAGR